MKVNCGPCKADNYSAVSRIKVLHIHTLPVISGSGINTLLSMAKINLARFEPELACADGGKLIELAQSSGFKVRPIKNFTRPISPLKDIMAVFELAFLLRKVKYEIVHTHNSKAGFIGRLAAKLAGTPVIVHTVHGFAFHPYERFWRRKIFILLERLAAKWCDIMIAISDALIDWAVKEKIAPRAKMIKIYSGIEIEKFSLKNDMTGSGSKAKRTELGIKDNDLVVAEVAKLWRGKGQDVLINAVPRILKEVPNLKVIFVGEGQTEAELRNLSRKLNIEDKIIFTGFRTDIAEITFIFDVACLPSLWEGMGRSVLEALACGKPVVASRVGGIADLIHNGITGFLVPAQDTIALASAIIKLLKDEGLRIRMGQEAKRSIDAKFSAQKMAEDIEAVYSGLLRKKGLTV